MVMSQPRRQMQSTKHLQLTVNLLFVEYKMCAEFVRKRWKTSSSNRGPSLNKCL